MEKLIKGKAFNEVIGILLGYYTGKIIGWFYCFYILAIIGGMLGADGSMGMSFFPALFFFKFCNASFSCISFFFNNNKKN